MTSNHFTDRLTQTDAETLGVTPNLYQLLYNLGVDIDLSIASLKASHHPFSAGETYRTARAELSLLSGVFEVDSPAGNLIQEMIDVISNLSEES